MKDLHSFAWYAAKISPYLPKEAFKPVPARLFGGLAYFLVMLAGIISISLFSLPIWANLLISVVIGLSFAGLGFLGHEILHGTVVRKPLLRDFLGAIAFFPFNTGPKLWRKWHNLNHHVHTQHEEHDPDTWATAEAIVNNRFFLMLFKIPKFIRSIGYVLFLCINFTVHSTRMFFTFIKDFKKDKRYYVVLEWLLPWATWIALFVILGPFKWTFAYLVPALIGNFIVSSYIATNHNLNPQTPVNDPLANSLSVTVPKWVNVLHFNFSYHTEHHLFPGMSSKFYPLVKEKIKEMWPERYHEMSMQRAMITLIKTPRIYWNEIDLVDLRANMAYGSLGAGLNPKELQKRNIDLMNDVVEIKNKMLSKGK
ncbi:acyl-CoA desaturase [Bacillus sp. HMF5848]|uniref:fatty acid desaturase family protein n=1 Tax=Bacillus sp. HMF5848 TaxID=2495421 RepID=UPI000F790061|nr:acyl-CoA desaturase [Bacillus sp. HMF5848]RSK26025.1 acyl-CoA desaturase [Bacillus sp. HMF5848]